MVDFDLVTAIPIGLILNEVITNAVKYAGMIPGYGIITIKLKLSGDDEILLSLSDNGLGFPKDFNIENTSSFGMILIKGLVEDLGGKLDIFNDNGASVIIGFNYKCSNKEGFAHITN